MQTKGPASQRKLSNLIIDPEYQYQYMMWSLLVGCVLVTIFGSVFYHFMQSTYDLMIEVLKLAPSDAEEFRRNFKLILGLLLIVSVLFVGVTAVLALFFSHRTAGPLYHFKRVFNEIENGNRSARVRLRPKDDFQAVAMAFNAMMDSIEGKASATSEVAAAVSEKVETPTE
ncbi:MAG: methyl-accepting chemotaxis protein [Methylotenera sp.]|nr:methyl-accepting chemotaxis protein [Oligoflexia bacterium]